MIKQNIINLIKKNKMCKIQLQVALEKSAPTIQRYLDTNDIMLTTAAAVKVISKYLNVKETDVLEPVAA